MNIETAMIQERRLAVLKLLLTARVEVGDATMMHALHQSGRRVRVDVSAVRSDFKYLEEVMCVETTLLDDRVLTARITARGALVAKGNLQIDGIADALLER